MEQRAEKIRLMLKPAVAARGRTEGRVKTWLGVENGHLKTVHVV